MFQISRAGRVYLIKYWKMIQYFPITKALLNEDLPTLGKFLGKTVLPKKNLMLIYDGIRDSFSWKAFQNKVQGKGPTVICILSERGLRFGMYTSIPWSMDGNVCDMEAFVFSLSHGTKHVLREDKNHKMTVFHSGFASPCLFAFGQPIDIYIHEDSNANIRSYASLGNTFEPPLDTFLDLDTNGYLTLGMQELRKQQIKSYLAGEYHFRVL